MSPAAVTPITKNSIFKHQTYRWFWRSCILIHALCRREDVTRGRRAAQHHRLVWTETGSCVWHSPPLWTLSPFQCWAHITAPYLMAVLVLLMAKVKWTLPSLAAAGSWNLRLLLCLGSASVYLLFGLLTANSPCSWQRSVFKINDRHH